MKKLILLLGVMLVTISANAQFVLTPDGLRSSENIEQDYIVIEADDKTASELYLISLANVRKFFVEYKHVAYRVTDKMITVKAEIPYCIGRTKRKTPWCLHLSLVIEVKDGRVKINAPNIKSIQTYNGEMVMFVRKERVIFVGRANIYYIYNKGGKLKSKQAKETLENTVNSIFSDLIGELTATNEDW